MDRTVGSDGARLDAALRAQADSCAALGSPFTARLLTGLAGRIGPGTRPGARLRAWQGDLSSRGDAVALRLAGGLHALVLGAQDAGLARLYAPPFDADGPALAAAALAAMDRHGAFLAAWLDSPPQTNEAGRSAALIAAAHWLTDVVGLPLIWSELGASAGLNLIWDAYALEAGGRCLGGGTALRLSPDWQGPPPTLAPPRVAGRAGVDLNPCDPVADRLRLLAYLWPDQADRLDQMRRALDAAARLRPPVARGDAIDWLDGRLRQTWPGHVHVVCHTIAWQYFPAAAQARGEALLAAAGARATAEAPLVRLAMEADGAPRGAALVLTLWPGGHRVALGRVDFHGRWIDWAGAAAVRPGHGQG